MPVSLPMPTKNAGDVFTSALWNSYLRDNINKLLNTGHRMLTVAQFAAITLPEGTKGSIAPDEVYVEIDNTNGIVWHFAFESGEPTYKWRFLGGPPLVAVGGSLTTSSTVMVDLTSGPTLTVPRLGSYDVESGLGAFTQVAASIDMSYQVLFSTTGNLTSILDIVSSAVQFSGGAAAPLRAISNLVTNETCKVQVANNIASSARYKNAFIQLIPRRIG